MNMSSHTKKTIIITSAITMIIIILIISTFYLFKYSNISYNGIPMVEANVVSISDSNITKNIIQNNYGDFETYMTSIWTFSDGKSTSNDAILGNSINNSVPIYCTVTLNTTGENIYTSDIIPVGTMLSDISIDTDLKASTYGGTCMVHMLSQDTDDNYVEDSCIGFDINIIILN